LEFFYELFLRGFSLLGTVFLWYADVLPQIKRKNMPRGGARKNAGRKPDPNRRKMLGLKLPPELHRFLDTQPNKTRFIEDTLRRSAAFRTWAKTRPN